MNGEDRITAKKTAAEVLPEVQRVQAILADHLIALKYLWVVVDGKPKNQESMGCYQLGLIHEQLAICEESLCRIS